MTRSQVDVLVNSEMPTVKGFARQQHRSWPRISEAEFVSAGSDGLLRAAKRFDPSSGRPFAPYARRFILFAMRTLIARETGRPEAELEAMEKVSETDGNHDDLPPVDRGPLLGFDDTPKDATAVAIKRARIRVVRFAFAVLMQANRPLDPESLLLEREETEHATSTVNRAMSDVTPEQREAFRLRHIEDMSELEVAARLGISDRTVRRHLRRVEAAIRDALVRAGIETSESMGRVLFAVGEASDDGDD